jgi:hypothetical protein
MSEISMPSVTSSLFGFETIYEGIEFPGFLAIRCGMAIFGLSANKELPAPGAHQGVRWQLIADDVDEIASIYTREIWPTTSSSKKEARLIGLVSPE